MKYLFDASAIFSAIKENKIDDLIGNYTLELVEVRVGKHRVERLFSASKNLKRRSKNDR